jgi:hypothetical protein
MIKGNIVMTDGGPKTSKNNLKPFFHLWEIRPIFLPRDNISNLPLLQCSKSSLSKEIHYLWRRVQRGLFIHKIAKPRLREH